MVGDVGVLFLLKVLVRRDYLANVTSLAYKRRKREHPEFCCKMGIRWTSLVAAPTPRAERSAS
jgi:hypothetical protein